jgi:adenosylcobinamide amidohydrolase
LKPLGKETKINGIKFAQNELDTIISSSSPLECLSSASINGGRIQSQCIVNHHVGKNFSHNEFLNTFAQLKAKYNLPDTSIIFLTAVPMENAIFQEFNLGSIPAFILVTAGTTNSCSPMDQPNDLYPISNDIEIKSEISLGTINTILCLDGTLPEHIMTNLFILLTETKTSVLHDAKIMTKQKNLATGTTTDAIGIISTNRNKKIQWSGLATEFGYIISKNYQQALKASLKKGGYF